MNTIRYIGSFTAATLRGKTHTVRVVVDAPDMEAARQATEQHMKLYVTPPMFPPVLIGLEVME